MKYSQNLSKWHEEVHTDEKLRASRAVKNGCGTQKFPITAFQNHLQTKFNLHIFIRQSQFINAISPCIMAKIWRPRLGLGTYTVTVSSALNTGFHYIFLF